MDRPKVKLLIIDKSSILAHFAIFVHDKVFTIYFEQTFSVNIWPFGNKYLPLHTKSYVNY